MDAVRILFVCTGNICRSPMAERLTRAHLDEVLGARASTVSVTSAGTHAVVGGEMEPSSAAVLAGLGGDPRGFRARQLTAGMAESADLVLTMTRNHRRSVLKLAPRTMFRTYTLREAADLLQDVDVDRLPGMEGTDGQPPALVRALGQQRGTRRRGDREQDDVFDPIGHRESVHQDVGEMIVEALYPLLDALCAERAPVAAPQDDDTQWIVPTRFRVA
ncbi:arsenate reductase/protein-tyrosine-phosphatase family protein [Blastococcus deserti]|uniref:Phosphotyrosine protein phosphatase I domain-containing protein n=1 Tax=Blastococcus deserti TaxID=2259033 RepID=A0ABW4XCT7_9ACTN